MKEYSIPMALVDFIPVVLYILANCIILKDLKNKKKSVLYILYPIGVFLVFAAGALKAMYKLLYAAGVGDFEWMSNQFFSNQSFGFLLAGIGLLVYVCSSKPKKNKVNGFIPVMGLVGLMVAGLGLIDGSFCALCVRQKKKGTMVLFILSFVFCMMMGYLSSRSFASASMNWIAQGINTFAQLFLFVGCRELEKAGLADL